MATFSYTALDPTGQKRSGVVEAASRQAAIESLSSEGRFVVDIAESDGASARPRAEGAAREEVKKGGRATKADIALFIRRMADLSGAGLPLDRVLQVLIEQTEGEQLSEAAEMALEEVRGGLPVSEALGKQPKIFPNLITMTLAAGEASGQFAEAAARLAELLENQVARRSQVISALIYPGVLLSTAVLVIIFLLTFVVPRLSGVFEEMESLPVPTEILLGTTDFLVGNWLIIILVVVGSLVAFRLWTATASGSYARDNVALNAPMFGQLVRKATVSRYARVLGTLLFGGVPILEALRLSALAAGNRVFEERSLQVENDVREGRGIAEAMRDAGPFPPVLTHMVAIGEETGKLPEMLDRVSNTLDFEVETGLRRLTSLLEPVIVLAMGVFVAFVVLSVMLPIFQAQELVK